MTQFESNLTTARASLKALNRLLLILAILTILLLVTELLIQERWIQGSIQITILAAFLIYAGVSRYQLNRGFSGIIERLEKQNRHLSEFITGFSHALEQVRDGDLTVDLGQLQQHEEFLQAVESLSCSLQSMTGMLRKIQKTSADVTNQAHRILETSGDQASGSSEQAAAVAEITSAMEELARTAAQIAENTGRVVRNSEDSELRATEGIEYMSGSIGSMQRMNQRMNDINENAHQLGEKFQQIDKILALINSIASETHILALNAAIEAASAGEFGARFSVIALEVRRLSDMSQNAVDEIKKILGDFQRSIQSTILATEQGTKEFHLAVEFGEKIQSKLSSITDQVSQTTRSAKEISLATQQQKTASDQIVETLKDISVVTRQIAGALQDFTQAATRLNSLAMDMQLISQTFIIASERNIKYIAKKSVERPEIIDFRRQNPTPVLEEIIRANPFLESIYIASAEGYSAAFAVAESLKRNGELDGIHIGEQTGQRPWFIRAMETGTINIINMYKSSITKDDCFTVSAPIRDAAGKITGVLGVDVNARNWSRIE